MLRNNSLHEMPRQQVFPEAHGVPDYDGRRAVRPLGWVGPGGEVRSNNTRSSAFVIILQDAPPPTKLGTYRFVAATVGSTVTVRRAHVRRCRPHEVDESTRQRKKSAGSLQV